MQLLPQKPPFDLTNKGLFVYPYSSISPVIPYIYDQSPRFFGRQGALSLAMIGKHTKISSHTRIFAGFSTPANQAVLDQQCEKLRNFWDDLGFCWQGESYADMAKQLISPALRSVYKPKAKSLVSRYSKKAQFGGLTGVIEPFAWCHSSTILQEYDLKNAYPTALSEDIPQGHPRPLSRCEFLQTDLIELWRAKVDSKGTMAPFGLLRKRKRTGEIYSPVMEQWEGYFWGYELQTAIDHGYKVQPLQGFGYQKGKPFDALLRKLRDYDYGFDDALRKYIKTLQVSIVGLLSQRTGNARTIFTDSPKEGDIPICLDYGLYKRATKKAQGLPPWNREQIASYVWAKVRSQLYREIVHHQDKLICYHTDGFITKEPITPVNPLFRAKRHWIVEEYFYMPHAGALVIDHEIKRYAGLDELLRNRKQGEIRRTIARMRIEREGLDEEKEGF